MAMMAHAVLGRGMLSNEVPKLDAMAADDVRARLAQEMPASRSPS